MTVVSTHFTQTIMLYSKIFLFVSKNIGLLWSETVNVFLCSILLTWNSIFYTPLGNAAPNFLQHLPGFSAYKSVVTNKRCLKYLSLMYVQKKNVHGSGLNNVADSDVLVANRTVSTQQQRCYICWQLHVFSRLFAQNFVSVFLTNDRLNPDVEWRIRAS